MASLDMGKAYDFDRETINDIVTRKSPIGEDYKNFKFSYATSPKVAFEKECRNYHDFGESRKLNNNYHPDRPARSGWKCLVCGVFD